MSTATDETLKEPAEQTETKPTEQPIDLMAEATDILHLNDRGSYTIPAENLYPHQWLWDSCFISIGWRHLDVERAKMEILSLLRGQWSNGMLPNMIFSPEPKYRHDRSVWRSWVNPHSPDDIATSGITQPPMLAEAVLKIGEKLPLSERRSWYKMVLPALVAYHEWMYKERDPHGEGLALLIHPWETGLDNTPPWMAELHDHLLPWWVRALKATKLDSVISLFRRDTIYIPPGQRFSTIEILALFSVQRRLRRKMYNIDRILTHSLFAIEDVAFNSIFIRANECLTQIARTCRFELPDELVKNMDKTVKALEKLWDPYAQSYFSRDFVTHRLLKEPSIATLLPLYAGTVTPERAQELVRLLENEHIFGPSYPVPSAPLNSPMFDPKRYWQGPSWVNTNWLIIEGLKRYGFKDHAAALTESTLEMVKISGMAEYFDPVTAEPLGAHNFSWTAALTIDLLKQ